MYKIAYYIALSLVVIQLVLFLLILKGFVEVAMIPNMMHVKYLIFSYMTCVTCILAIGMSVINLLDIENSLLDMRK